MAKPQPPKLEALKAELEYQPVEAEPLKLIDAFTVVRDGPGWRMVTFTISSQGQVVAVKSTEPDLKILAIEALKLAQVKWWTKL
jgi:hypothetical protein